MQTLSRARARSYAPPILALMAFAVFAVVVMMTTGCTVTPDQIDAAGGVIDSTEAIVKGVAVAAVGGPTTPWSAIIAAGVGMAYAEARSRLLGWSRDKRKKEGADPLQLSGVFTPPVDNPQGGTTSNET